jgi:KaiC/GvpD/RAD55 family RecA-like ATPase
MEMTLERVPTGIEGLDRLIGGGLVRGTWTLAWAFQDEITGMDLITGTPGYAEGDRLRAMVEKDVNNIIYFRMHEGQRELKIIKIEAIDHPLDWLPFNITKDGIVL